MNFINSWKKILQTTESVTKRKTIKRLSELYGGPLPLPARKDGFVNLSSIELTEKQAELLNLGLNCHVQPPYDIAVKKREIELLYQSIEKQEKSAKVIVNPNLKERLLGESTIKRSHERGKVLTKAHREAAAELRNNPDIVIRRADKSNVYVILDRDEYLQKMDKILSDKTKFECVREDNTAAHKAKVNRLIASTNAKVGGVHFETIVGEYKTGYAYGNVKIHKQGNPLRPIISQCPTPTYKLAKDLNKLIAPYIPAKYALKSTDEFTDILRCNTPKGTLASLDVESLFTNVPVKDTIDIIQEFVYNHPELPPLDIPPKILTELLKACTSEAVFRAPDNKLYRQTNGVAMGSPLGPLFANAYMCKLENTILENSELRPYLYCRYVDDIFLDIRDQDHLHKLKEEFENCSALKFTIELSVQNRIPFLDVDIDGNGVQFKTKVFKKATDAGNCLNAASECPESYKLSVIRSYVRKAIKLSSDWKALHSELQRVKQVLVNNGYSNCSIDEEIKKQLNMNVKEKDQKATQKSKIQLFYMNQMSSAYKTDERVLKKSSMIM